MTLIDTEKDMPTLNQPVKTVYLSKKAREQLIKEQAKIVAVGQELTAGRTADTKVRKGANGQFIAEVYAGRVHWFDKEDSIYRDFDLSEHEVLTLAKLNPFREFDKYVEIGDAAMTWKEGKRHDYSFRTSDDHYVTWKALFDPAKANVTIKTRARKSGVKQDVILADSTSATEFRWLVESDCDMNFDGGELIFRADGKFIARSPPMTAWDANRADVPVKMTMQGDTLTTKLTIPDRALWPVTLDPSTTIDAGLQGAVRENDATYANARTATSGDGTIHTYPRVEHVLDENYYIYRGFLTFDLSGIDNNAIAIACSLIMDGNIDLTTSDYNIFILQATHSVIDVNTFNDFTGWDAGGNFSNVIKYNDGWNTVNYSNNNNYLPFNSTGIANLESEFGSSDFDIALLSENDIDGNVPSGAHENATQFSSSPAPYLTVWYTVPDVNDPSLMVMRAPSDPDSTGYLYGSWENNHSAGIDSLTIWDTADNWVKKLGAVTDTTTILTGLGLNERIGYYVRADSAAYSGQSGPDSVYTLAASPAAFAFAATDTNKVSISFSANGNPDSVLYAIRDSTRQAWVTIDGDTTTVAADWRTRAAWLPVEITDLSPETEYEFGVVGKNDDGVQTDYLWGVITTDFAIRDFNLTVVSATSINATWDFDATPDSIIIRQYVDDVPVGSYISPATSESTTVNDLTPNTLYSWYLYGKAGDAEGTSDADSTYTLAIVPIADSIAIPSSGDTSFDFHFNTGDNSASTDLAIAVYKQDVDSLYYWDGAALKTTETWQDSATWGNPITIDDQIAVDKTYAVGIKARNGDNVETAFDWAWVRTFELTITNVLGARNVKSFNGRPNTNIRTSYSLMRDETNPDSIRIDSDNSIGQTYNAGGPTYEVWRLYHEFIIPSTPNNDTAVLNLYGNNDQSDAYDFNIQIFESTWTPANNAKDKYWRFDGRQAAAAHNGTSLGEVFNTSGFNAAGDNLIPFNSDGLTTVNAAIGDTLRLIAISSKDSTNTAPDSDGGDEDEYVDIDDAKVNLTLTYEESEALPSSFAMMALSSTEIAITWDDSLESNWGYRAVDASSGTIVAGSDTLTANAEADTITGLAVNTKYDWKIEVLGGTLDGQYSAADSAYTLAAAPSTVPVLVFSALGDTAKIAAAAGSLGTGNPSYTEIALQDSITGYYVDFSADPDTLFAVADSLAAWGWRDLAELADTIRVYIYNQMGRQFALRFKARSGE